MKIRPTSLMSVVLLAVLAVGGAAFAQTMSLNLGYSLSPDSHYGAGAQAFAREVDRLSEGRIRIVEQPANALGGEREMIEGLQIGSVDLVITSTGPVGNFVPEVLVLDLPFLFRDYEHARGVLDGEIGQELLERFPERGIIALAWTENGFRHLTNNRRPVSTPADLQGLKIRTMENQVHIRAFQAAGAAPTPMAFPELFTALQQGTVDGQENPIPVITSANFQEVQRYLSLTGHVYSPALLLVSPFVWDRLSEEEQSWFREAARASVEATRNRVSEVEQEGVERLRAAGMDVTTDIDIEPFQEAVAPAYEEFTRQYGDELLERIRNYEGE